MAVQVRECWPEQIVAKEQPRPVQQLTDQRSSAAVETCHYQLIAQRASSLWLGPKLGATRAQSRRPPVILISVRPNLPECFTPEALTVASAALAIALSNAPLNTLGLTPIFWPFTTLRLPKSDFIRRLPIQPMEYASPPA